MRLYEDADSREPRGEPHSLRFCLWGGLLALTVAACADVSDPHRAIDDDYEDAPDEGAELESKTAIRVSVERARRLAQGAPKAANGLPLWQSRPGARVALFLDFDGGRYSGETYRGIDLDGNRSRFGSEEQTAILRAALEVVEGYAGFNVNVTTSEDVMREADKWGWILITDDEGGSGEAYVGSIARSSKCSRSSCSPMGFAGSEAVFSPPSAQRGYLLIHELGHQFGLNHSGLYKNGRFYEWSELKQDLTGDWMGGRSSFFDDFSWLRSQTKYSTSIQDPKRIIGSLAGYVNDDDSATDGRSEASCHDAPLNDSYYCSSGCRCDEGEGDCDTNTECATGLVCEQRSGTDVCVKPSGGASCHQGPLNGSYYCSSGCRCDEGEGDCDTNAECATGLVCEQRSGTDVCVKPSGGASCHQGPLYNAYYCTSACPCDEGEGDCDGDSQCAPGLVCVERPRPLYDYCARP